MSEKASIWMGYKTLKPPIIIGAMSCAHGPNTLFANDSIPRQTDDNPTCFVASA